MKITNLRTAVVHFPFDPPIDGGAIMLRSSDCVLVYLETDAGLVGEGLVFALNQSTVEGHQRDGAEPGAARVGLDPHDAGAFMVRAWREIGFLGRTGVAVIGLAAVDNALWDLRGKAVGLNVSRLIGACTTTVPVYHSGGLWIGRSIDELQREAADFVRQGYRAMKMRIGKFSAEEEVARVRAVREAIGPDIALMIDANQQLDVPRTIRLGRMLEEFNLTWFEEPIRYDDHSGEAEIAAALVTPIASGETEYTSRGMHEMLRLKSADILMPDLQRMGGPTEFLKAARLAEAYNTPVSPHLFPEMNVVVARRPRRTRCYLEYMPWCAPAYRERIEIDAQGRAIVPDRPGWGFSFDPAAVKRYAA